VELELSEDQAFFLETTRRFLAAASSIPTVRALEHERAGWTAAYWRQGAELGWTSMLVPEADGGGSLSEHGLLDLVLVAEEMGRCVAPGPLAPVNLVASALAARGTAEQRAAVLPGLLDGSAVAAWGGIESVAGIVADGTLTLTGRIPAVEAGGEAAHLLVVAATPGGLTHVLVPAGAAGLTVTPRRSLDLVRRYAEVSFDGVALPVADAVVGNVDGAADEVERLLQIACVLQAAETCGVVDKVFAMTVEYLGDRYSFGRPLSSYQALKHRLADDKTHLEACLATAGAAARAVATGAADAGELVSVAKAWIGPHATEIIQDGVQLHGGIGVTWEHDLHLYLRRATVNRVLHGTPEWHADRIAALQLGVVA
jgi:alkylation response protein AidB-like acyl-CoA dehydrogenase